MNRTLESATLNLKIMLLRESVAEKGKFKDVYEVPEGFLVDDERGRKFVITIKEDTP